VHKKESTCRLLFAGFTVLIVTTFLDRAGVKFGLWSYPVSFLPLMPDFVIFDLSLLPVVTMLFIQFFPNVRPYIKGIIYAVVGALVFQPLMRLMGFYCGEIWKDWYSLPFLFGIYMMDDFAATRKSFQMIR
jgi:hypothetical protein